MIGDLTKVQLFALSKELNDVFAKEVVPHALLPDVQGDAITWEMPPSAELKEDQLDPMKWFYHDYLVEHLDVYKRQKTNQCTIACCFLYGRRYASYTGRGNDESDLYQ